MRFGEVVQPHMYIPVFHVLEQRSARRGQGADLPDVHETGPFKNLATLVHDPYFMQE